jgi:predicted nucleic acid-binding protein
LTFVDTNVLVDLLRDDERWAEWSVAQLDAALLSGPVFIDSVVYAELAVRYTSVEDVDAFVSEARLKVVEAPRQALFLAAKAFVTYRRAGGTRTGVLPDFFIGAHAVVAGMPLITRDARRYRSYFPTIELISPDG